MQLKEISLVSCLLLQASSKVDKFGPRRAKCNFFWLPAKKTKYTGVDFSNGTLCKCDKNSPIGCN